MICGGLFFRKHKISIPQNPKESRFSAVVKERIKRSYFTVINKQRHPAQRPFTIRVQTVEKHRADKHPIVDGCREGPQIQ